VGTGARNPLLVSLLPVVSGVAMPLLFAFWLTAASDECADAAPVTDTELREATAGGLRLVDRLDELSRYSLAIQERD
jgi:hypothetical protein